MLPAPPSQPGTGACSSLQPRAGRAGRTSVTLLSPVQVARWLRRRWAAGQPGAGAREEHACCLLEMVTQSPAWELHYRFQSESESRAFKPLPNHRCFSPLPDHQANDAKWGRLNSKLSLKTRQKATKYKVWCPQSLVQLAIFFFLSPNPGRFEREGRRGYTCSSVTYISVVWCHVYALAFNTN